MPPAVKGLRARDQQSVWSRPHKKKNKGSSEDVHLDLLVPSATCNLVRDEVDTVDLVRVSGQVNPDLERLEIPQLYAQSTREIRTFLLDDGAEARS